MIEIKLATGIPKLDDFLSGGLEIGTTTVFWTQPGINEAPFAYQLLDNQLSRGNSGIFIVQTKKAGTVEGEIRDHGWDISKYKRVGSFVFIDAYSPLVKAESREKFIVGNPNNVRELTAVLERAMKDVQQKNMVVIFGSLSTMVNNFFKDYLDETKKWKSMFKKYGAAGVFMFTQWPYSSQILKKVRDTADNIVELKAIEEKVILREYFTVPKTKSGRAVKKAVPFRIKIPGGVYIYIPKILVTGNFKAGKSSFVHSASSQAVSVNRMSTTIALDHGHVDYKGFSVDLFGTPGQERFDPILKVLGHEALGVIVVVDSTDPDTFGRAQEMVAKSGTVGLPTVIAANKANLKGALKVSEIRKRMQLPKKIPIIPTVAEDLSRVRQGQPCKIKSKDIEKVLDSLFSLIV